MSITESAAEWVAVGDLVPWDQNPRVNDAAVGKVAASIKRFGFGAPIVARRADGMVIAGHTRLKAAHALGLYRVPVRFLDLDPADAKMLALADNRVGEEAQWDDGALSVILASMRADDLDLDALGFSNGELEVLLDQWIDPFEGEGGGGGPLVDPSERMIRVTVPLADADAAREAIVRVLADLGVTAEVSGG